MKAYHQRSSGSVVCSRCGKPMSEWKAWDECPPPEEKPPKLSDNSNPPPDTEAYES